MTDPKPRFVDRIPRCFDDCPAYSACPSVDVGSVCAEPRLRALAESEARLRKAGENARAVLRNPAVSRVHGVLLCGDDCLCRACTADRILSEALEV